MRQDDRAPFERALQRARAAAFTNGDYAGLRRFAGGTVESKPAFFAFRRVAHQLRAAPRRR